MNTKYDGLLWVEVKMCHIGVTNVGPFSKLHTRWLVVSGENKTLYIKPRMQDMGLLHLNPMIWLIRWYSRNPWQRRLLLWQASGKSQCNKLGFGSRYVPLLQMTVLSLRTSSCSVPDLGRDWMPNQGLQATNQPEVPTVSYILSHTVK
jgi:hypothetical protein